MKNLFLILLLGATYLPQFACGEESLRTFANPILSGFYPDPSLCRAGDDYYLVNSTFEYFPGVPIFHSKDLVHWRQIGHVLTRPSQLPLRKMRSSGGVFAPTLRYHDGTFYMVTTNVWGTGNFYVTATDPAGPWSEPHPLDREGIDPSLFFDDDGTVYYIRHVGGEDGYIGQQVLNLETGKLAGEMKEIWGGTGGVWAEGPHMYKKDGRYYLMVSEGGTSYNHMVTIARSDSPWGPFEASPHNPILTHRNRPDHPVQALGHADLVETPAGWWAVFLGIRPQGERVHHIGRETYLAPVTWSDDGWPTIGTDGAIELAMAAPKLAPHPWPKQPARDEFDGDSLALEWNFLRNPHDGDWSLTERPGFLSLNGSAVTLSDQDSPAFVGRRQTGLACRVATQLEFNPASENEEAGLVVRGNDANHYELGVTLRDGHRQVFFRKVLGGKPVEPIRYEELPPGGVVLSIAAKPLEYEFCYQVEGGSPVSFGTAATQDLSSEKIGGFTGVYFGMYATGNGKASTVPADFAWFDYEID
ncbi:MAG: glycoside hydrolase family 43 protein [Pirellulales bacterium]